MVKRRTPLQAAVYTLKIIFCGIAKNLSLIAELNNYIDYSYLENRGPGLMPDECKSICYKKFSWYYESRIAPLMTTSSSSNTIC